MRARFCRMLVCLLGVFLSVSCFSDAPFRTKRVRPRPGARCRRSRGPGRLSFTLNTETQVTLRTVSDASGVFIFSPLTPGAYQVTVTAAGFSNWVESGMVLEVGEKNELSPVLKIGPVLETVSVTAVAEELKVSDSDLSTVTESALVANIPLDVRNPFQEVNFTPGVTQSSSLSAGTNSIPRAPPIPSTSMARRPVSLKS